MSWLTEDRRLLERFRAGDEPALREVFRHYAPGLARYVARAAFLPAFRGRGGDIEVWRIVHDTFSRAFVSETRLRFDGLGSYRGYLCTIARNLLVDDARARGRLTAGDLTADGALPECQAPEPTPEEVAERAQMTAVVQDVVRAQPQLERSVYRARFEAGMTQEQAAASLGIGRITVRRAEVRLKRALAEELRARGMLPGAPRGGGSHEP